MSRATDLLLGDENPADVPYLGGELAEPAPESIKQGARLPLPTMDDLARPSSGPPPLKAPSQSPQEEGSGFDWQRALASLFGGSASVQDVDRVRAASAAQRAKAADDAEERKYRAAKEKREQGKYELERDIMSPLKARKLGADADKIGSEIAAKALSNGSTQESKEVREAVAARFELQAAQMKGSEFAQMFADAGRNMRVNGNISGIAALDLAKQYNVSVDDIARAAVDKAKQNDVAADNSMNSSREAELERHNRAMEALGGRRTDASEAKQLNVKSMAQEKLNAEINDRTQAIENMNEIGRLKKDVNTGFLTGLVSKWIGKPFDLNSASRNDMEALLARTFNKETKELAGSAVSTAEWERIAPQIPQITDDDGIFRGKLAKAIKIANEILAKRKQQYQLNPNGTATDSSRTGRRAAAEGNMAADKKATSSTPGPNTAAPTQAAAPDDKDAQAIQWAKSHPDDPRAQQILKLHGM